jgi:O-phospho-L-seryl-tRNASec:L-selenocysteinyl-tRNA synthase
VTAIQPKAAGSSVLVQLTNRLALDILQTSGIVHCKACFVVPVATGMSIVLTLSALKSTRPKATKVIWSRIDQKSCFKAIRAAGLEPIIVELNVNGDQLETDVEGIRNAIEANGPDDVLCVMTTTSCFAPRSPDDLPSIAKICRSFDVPHIVNNAYGVQSSKCTHLLEQVIS